MGFSVLRNKVFLQVAFRLILIRDAAVGDAVAEGDDRFERR